MRALFLLASLFISLVSTTATAAPGPFIYEPPAKGADSEKKMLTVYEPIVHNKGSARARLAILTGMTLTRGHPWQLEEEGEGYVVVRWDYRGHTAINRIEYDDKLIQVKYSGGLKGYECKMPANGYCYKAHRGYYKFSVWLREKIQESVGE